MRDLFISIKIITKPIKSVAELTRKPTMSDVELNSKSYEKYSNQERISEGIMNTKASVTLKSGKIIIVDVVTNKMPSRVTATIAYKTIRVYASGNNEQTAIRAAHEKFLAAL
jgi:hypothetical protein